MGNNCCLKRDDKAGDEKGLKTKSVKRKGPIDLGNKFAWDKVDENHQG